ncbi:hypothetical protein MTR_2g023140 [Medicago truncatula]|uniref:Protein FAR1-RELATED SEQUENCE n=1 Tax=Medicago truncatula TaxID=3880 RepID=A0A072V4Y9_MEDTR|nr:hypothetical protein MTR_2g023140 [Medicago truncatula]
MVMEAWESVVYCSDEVEYQQKLEVFKEICDDNTNFHDYVHEQWLIPHKERFVEAWTNKCSCHCTIRTTHGLPCACELARYSMMPSAIPLDVVHIFWRRLNFFDDGFNKSSEFSMKPEIDALMRRFDELDMCGKIALKSKVHELVFPTTTSMYPPPNKVNVKDAPKKGKREVCKRQKSTKCDPSWWEYVDAAFESQGSVQKLTPQPSILKFRIQQSQQKLTPRPSLNKVDKPRVMPFMEWLHKEIHHFIDHVLDVGPNGNCGYPAIGALLGRGEDSWPLIRQECLEELQEWREDYPKMFGGEDYVQDMIQSLYVNGYATRDKWMTLPTMGHVIASKYNITLVSLSVDMPIFFSLLEVHFHHHLVS